MRKKTEAGIQHQTTDHSSTEACAVEESPIHCSLANSALTSMHTSHTPVLIQGLKKCHITLHLKPETSSEPISAASGTEMQ